MQGRSQLYCGAAATTRLNVRLGEDVNILECVWFVGFLVMEDRDKLYQASFKSYVLAYPSKSKRTWQDELNSKWNEIKKTDNFPMRAEQLMMELKTTAMTNKGSLIKFWSITIFGVIRQKQSTSSPNSSG